jgi:hypothetical protein
VLLRIEIGGIVRRVEWIKMRKMHGRHYDGHCRRRCKSEESVRIRKEKSARGGILCPATVEEGGGRGRGQ